MNVDCGVLNRHSGITSSDCDYEDANANALYLHCNIRKTTRDQGKSKTGTTGSAATVTTAEGTSLAGAGVVKNSTRTRTSTTSSSSSKMPGITPEQVQAYQNAYLSEELEFQKRGCQRRRGRGSTCTPPQEAEEGGPPCREIVFLHKSQHKQKELPKNPPREASRTSTQTGTSTSTHVHESRDQQQYNDKILRQLQQQQQYHDRNNNDIKSRKLGLWRDDGTLDLCDDDIQDRCLLTTPEGEVVEVIRVKRTPRKAPTCRPSRHLSSGLFGFGQVRKYFSPTNSKRTNNNKSNLHVIDLRNGNGGSTRTRTIAMAVALKSDQDASKEPTTLLQHQDQDRDQDKSNIRRGSF